MTESADSHTADSESTARERLAEVRYEPDDRRDLTTAIVTAVAAADDVDPLDLPSPPLYDVVDVEAIDRALFGRSRRAPADRRGSIEFTYRGLAVVVRSDGWVVVYDRDATNEWTADRSEEP